MKKRKEKMNVIDNGITNIFLYSNEMNMNDIFDSIQKRIMI